MNFLILIHIGFTLFLFGVFQHFFLEKVKMWASSRQWLGTFVVTLALLLIPDYSWITFNNGINWRLLIIFISTILVWEAISKDYDLGLIKDNSMKWRFISLGLVVGLYFHPAFLAVLLGTLCIFLKSWSHHSFMGIRMLLVTLFYFISIKVCSFLIQSVQIESSLSNTTLIFLLLLVQLSHYFNPSIGKIKLGKNPLDWVLNNKLHYIAGCAYRWGWLRFISLKKMKNWFKLLAKLNVFNQSFTLFIEFAVVGALIHPYFLYFLLVSLCLLHFIIFICTGICFWKNTSINLFMLFYLLSYSQEFQPLFQIEWNVLFVVLTIGFPANHLIWKPDFLAWWDTPFIGKVDWVVEGQSGKEYGLYSDFMCPNERDYGQCFGWFMVPFKIFHWHIGEILTSSIRDEVFNSDGRREYLDKVKECFGRLYFNQEEKLLHFNYLKTFFKNFNQQKRKYFFPKFLKWLKAPGNQCFYWGDKQGFKGQENIKAVRIFYREEFFDGTEVKSIRKLFLGEVPI